MLCWYAARKDKATASVLRRHLATQAPLPIAVADIDAMQNGEVKDFLEASGLGLLCPVAELLSKVQPSFVMAYGCNQITDREVLVAGSLWVLLLFLTDDMMEELPQAAADAMIVGMEHLFASACQHQSTDSTPQWLRDRSPRASYPPWLPAAADGAGNSTRALDLGSEEGIRQTLHVYSRVLAALYCSSAKALPSYHGAWWHRFVANYLHYLQGVRTEVDWRRRSYQPTLTEYLELRLFSSCALPFLDLIELGPSGEFPDALATLGSHFQDQFLNPSIGIAPAKASSTSCHDAQHKLRVFYAAAIALENDLLSINKDLKDGNFLNAGIIASEQHLVELLEALYKEAAAVGAQQTEKQVHAYHKLLKMFAFWVGQAQLDHMERRYTHALA